MQLMHETTALRMTINDKKMNGNITVKDAASENSEVNKKKSNGSLQLINPVASGDNMALCLNSAHKLKEELPTLVPCCEGRELQINEDLVRTGLSVISMKHDSVIQCWSMSQTCERMQPPFGLVKHRNSFRCLHRPDLKRVPYLRRMTPDELETLFRGYADVPPKNNKNDNGKDTRNNILPHSEKALLNDIKNKENSNRDNGNQCNALHQMPQIRSGSEDVPAGMRLHGARARLYTSVLESVKTGDQLDGTSTNDEHDAQVPEETLPEEEVQLNEELQIILPPRCDDVTADATVSADS